MTTPTTAIVTAWQQVLGAEQAAVFGYSALGPRLGVADSVTARSDQAAHRTLRDGIEAAMVAAGVSPKAAAASYPVPRPLTTPLQARRFAAQLETACASSWRYLLASAATAPGQWLALRTDAQAGLTASAIRADRWQRRLTPMRAETAFPGI